MHKERKPQPQQKSKRSKKSPSCRSPYRERLGSEAADGPMTSFRLTRLEPPRKVNNSISFLVAGNIITQWARAPRGLRGEPGAGPAAGRGPTTPTARLVSTPVYQSKTLWLSGSPTELWFLIRTNENELTVLILGGSSMMGGGARACVVVCVALSRKLDIVRCSLSERKAKREERTRRALN